MKQNTKNYPDWSFGKTVVYLKIRVPLPCVKDSRLRNRPWDAVEISLDRSAYGTQAHVTPVWIDGTRVTRISSPDPEEGGMRVVLKVSSDYDRKLVSSAKRTLQSNADRIASLFCEENWTGIRETVLECLDRNGKDAVHNAVK